MGGRRVGTALGRAGLPGGLRRLRSCLDDSRDRLGHDGLYLHRLRRARGAGGARLSRACAALSAARLGRARPRGGVGARAGGRGRGAGGRGGGAGRARGGRAHQSARDRRVWDPRDGPAAAPGDRLAGPAHGRAVPRAARRGRRGAGALRRTGLVLDPYFSATKIEWLLDHVEGLRERALAGRALFGTVDSWLLFKLTAGACT